MATPLIRIADAPHLLGPPLSFARMALFLEAVGDVLAEAEHLAGAAREHVLRRDGQSEAPQYR